ncbi:MAG: cob(I)yrinic acid a,c-diamide adenosyltransferase [Candidatus Omnitrophota bacterium]|nr:MAG: cob(I)yrinic acid a,c-diamide adenosyltransferase [Candidatus Omnitrophota bacterium]
MIHVYTGEGKGKTTAALGLAVRAAGAGLRVFIGQFIKGRAYSECRSLKKIKNIKTEQFGRGCFIKRSPSARDIALAQQGLKRIEGYLRKNCYDIVILDEINVAVKLKLLTPDEVVSFLKRAPRHLELILTGRSAGKAILQLADLVSEIKEVKHYYRKGIKARKGIEY